MTGTEEDIESLKAEVENLKKKFALMKKEKKILMTKVRDTKNEIEAKKQHAAKVANEAARLASLSSTEVQLEQLKDVLKLYRIFGIEVTEIVGDGLSVTFHHWYKGVKVDEHSVAVTKGEEDNVIVKRHHLPPSAVSWMSKVPCTAPHHTVIDAIRDMKKSCFFWNNRYHQLEEFKTAYPDVKVHHPLSLLSIMIECEVEDTKSKQKKKKKGMKYTFEITLLYTPNSIYAKSIDVDVKENDIRDNDRIEKIEALKHEVDPFKTLPIKDAFYFIFEAKD